MATADNFHPGQTGLISNTNVPEETLPVTTVKVADEVKELDIVNASITDLIDE